MAQGQSNSVDPNFPNECDTDWDQIYCCQSGDSGGFLNTGIDDAGSGIIQVSGTGDEFCMSSFPSENDDGMPMLKTPLNATSQSPWVKIGFLSYNADGTLNSESTANTVLTMGNVSQPGTEGKTEICKAAIKAFQYGWGTTNQGNVVKVTIVDQKGAEFQDWVQRLIKNVETATTPVKGVYKMICQWGWYISGGGAGDQCGQPAGGSSPGDGENSSYII